MRQQRHIRGTLSIRKLYDPSWSVKSFREGSGVAELSREENIAITEFGGNLMSKLKLTITTRGDSTGAAKLVLTASIAEKDPARWTTVCEPLKCQKRPIAAPGPSRWRCLALTYLLV